MKMKGDENEKVAENEMKVLKKGKMEEKGVNEGAV
jgi:hypothetical protein